MIAIETYKVLDQLEMLVEDSKKFMGFVRLDEDEFFMLVSKLRASLPEDVRRAGKIAENTDRIMEAAQTEAERALADARADAERLLADAHAEAERMMAAAHADCERQVAGARADADRSLADARERADAMTEEAEIKRIAESQARDILAAARGEAEEIRRAADRDAHEIRSGADDYAHYVLGNLEKQVQETLTKFDGQFAGILAQIQRGRQSLEQASGCGASSVGSVVSSPGGGAGRGVDGMGGVSVIAERASSNGVR